MITCDKCFVISFLEPVMKVILINYELQLQKVRRRGSFLLSLGLIIGDCILNDGCDFD